MEREISCEEKITGSKLQDAKKNNRRLCFFIIGSSAMVGIVEVALGLPDRRPYLLTVFDIFLFNVIMLYWFANDIRIVNYPASRFLKFSVAAFGFAAIAYYLFRSRGFPGCLKSFSWVALLAIVSAISVGVVMGITLVVMFLSPY